VLSLVVENVVENLAGILAVYLFGDAASDRRMKNRRTRGVIPWRRFVCLFRQAQGAGPGRFRL